MKTKLHNLVIAFSLLTGILTGCGGGNQTVPVGTHNGGAVEAQEVSYLTAEQSLPEGGQSLNGLSARSIGTSAETNLCCRKCYFRTDGGPPTCFGCGPCP